MCNMLHIEGFCELDEKLILENCPSWLKKTDFYIFSAFQFPKVDSFYYLLGAFLIDKEKALGITVPDFESFDLGRFETDRDFFIGFPPIFALDFDVFAQKENWVKKFKPQEASSAFREQKFLKKYVKELSRYRFSIVRNTKELTLSILSLVEPLFEFPKRFSFRVPYLTSLMSFLRIKTYKGSISVRPRVLERRFLTQSLAWFSLRCLQNLKDKTEEGIKYL